MAKVYKKILFDLDNTLINDNENRKHAIKQILIDRRETVTDEKSNKFIEIDNQFWKDRTEGKIKIPDEFKLIQEKIEWLRAQRFIKFFQNVSLQEAIKINNDYINYLKNYVIPIKNAQKILKYLFEKDYEIYIITNGPKDAVNGKLTKIGVAEYIANTFTSEEAGHMKPHEQFFEKFFEKINCYKKDEMIIVGDELEKDVAGGIKNNIDTCWFNMNKIKNTTIFLPMYEINDLIELKNIL